MGRLGKSLSPCKKAYVYLHENIHIFGFWLFFRIFTSMIVVISSEIRPITEIEQDIAIWPPSLPLTDWFERVFISPWARWDAIWYTRIITDGYSRYDGTTNFHPLYPWLGKVLTTIKLNPIFSLLIVSTIASLLLILCLQRLLSLDTSNQEIKLSLLIFIVFPISFILFAPYAESLFILLSIICFIGLRKQKWSIAGFSAFLAVLTRQQGIFLIFPFIWELWEAAGKNIQNVRSMWRSWLALGLIPLAYLLWIGYRYFKLEEISIRTSSVNEIIYSIFISSSATKVVPNQKFLWPWNTLYQSNIKVINAPDLDIWINLVLALVFIVIIIVAWKHMSTSSRLYSAIIYFISFSYFTGPVHPLMGLPRHLYLAFPIFAGITPILAKGKPLILLYMLVGLLFMLILLTAYTLMAWVP